MGSPGTSRAGALSERPFRLLWLAATVSVLGDRIAPVATAFAVLSLTHRVSDLGLVLAAQSVPFAVLLLPAGVWADRHPRQRLMQLATVTQGAAQGLTAALFLTNHARLLWVVPLQAVYGGAEAFFRPAMTGLLPAVVSEPRLQQGNALIGLSQNVTLVIGPALAALLTAAFNPAAGLVLDAVSFAVCAGLLARLSRVIGPHPAAVDGRPLSFGAELRAGARLVWRMRWVRSLILTFTAYHALVLPGIYVLGPAIATARYGGAGAYAAWVSSFGIGAVLGGGPALRWRPRRPMVVCTAMLALGATQPAVMGSGLPSWGICLCLLAIGFAVPLLYALWETTLQREVPPGSLARVSSFDYLGSVALMPLGYVLVGPLAHVYGLTSTAVVLSAVGFGVAVLALVSPGVRAMQSRRA